jgi:DNA replication and repair protein RecF
LNLLTGDNGAGKTSVLEALHLMAYGRSFRGRVRDGLVRQGQEALEIFVEWDERVPITRPTAEGRPAPQWPGLEGRRLERGRRAAGQSLRSAGRGDVRAGEPCTGQRWGTPPPFPRLGFVPRGTGFSVPVAPLFPGAEAAQCPAQAGRAVADARYLDHELAEAGEPLTSRRQHYLERLQQRTVALAASLAPQLGIQGLELSPDGGGMNFPLADALLWLANATGRPATRSAHTGQTGVWIASIPGRDALSWARPS